MRRILFNVILSFVIISCNTDPINPSREIIDYGYVSTSTASSPARMFYHSGEIYVGSDDGIWKINLVEKIWKRSGLTGKKITALYKHPAVDGKFFAGVESTGPAYKSFYISDDSGLNWQAATSPVFSDINNRYETYSDIRARPGNHNQLFANLTGTTIAVSKDGGLTWNRQNYMNDSYFGDNCVINFLADNTNEVYQGAEAPLDHAWLGKYIINSTDPVLTGNLQRIIGDNYEWENRRPNCLETFTNTPGIFYAGLEGALAKVTGSQWIYLFKGSTAPDNFPYAYIEGIWVDPADSRHIIFGGGVNGSNTSLSLFETFDEGQHIEQLGDKRGMADPEVIDIVAAGNYAAVLIVDKNDNRMRLLLFKP